MNPNFLEHELIIWWSKGIEPILGVVMGNSLKRIKIEVGIIAICKNDKSVIRYITPNFIQKLGYTLKEYMNVRSTALKVEDLYETSLAIVDVIRQYPYMISVWKLLLKNNVKITCSLNGWLWDCYISAKSQYNNSIEVYHSAHSDTEALKRAMREAYRQITGKNAPIISRIQNIDNTETLALELDDDIIN